MAIVKMNKLSVIGMNSEKKDLLKSLMDLGMVEVSGSEEKLQDEDWKKLVVKDGDEETASFYDKKISLAESAIGVLKKYAGVKMSLFGTRKIVSEAEYDDMKSHESEYEAQAKEITDLDNQLNDAFAEENAANNLTASLTPWKSYELPLDLDSTERLKIRLGVVPPETDITALGEEIAGAGHECEIEEIGRDKQQCYLSLWYFREDEDDVLEIVKSHGWTNASIAGMTGTVEENIDSAAKKIEELGNRRKEIVDEIAGKASYAENIEYYHDIMVVKRDEARIRSRLLTTEETFTFDGWTPVAADEKVRAVLDSYTCWYELTEPEEDDDVPIRLKNSKFFSPIEFITKMYSLPSYNEIDPTSIYTFFYIIFFGIMFGDVGYGLIICIATALVLKKTHMYEGGAYKLMKTLFYSGISSVFWGFMFGSFFGDIIPVIADTFFDKTVVIKPLWLDPAKSPMLFLVFSCGLGVIHLFVGMGIKAYEEIKAGQVLDAVKDVFTWYLIVIGVILWIFGGRISDGAQGIGKTMSLVGFAMALILPIFTNKGVGKALGIWDLYSGITGQLSDILSYSRLLGLGLASTSIAQVFNFLASMGGKGVTGVLIFVVIGLLGHTLNFAINALGAFVHSCRLQFVEFFGKFYEGGGREFDPFNKNTKYINVVEEGK
jgi:V/A-type H+-transporting ATPase subunit I